MKKTFASLGVTLAVAAACMPATALAYLSPDQVFGNQSMDTPPAPPTQREGESVVSSQQQQSNQQRAQAQTQLQPVDATPKDTYTPPELQPQSKGLFDSNTQYERRMDRIQETHGAAPTIIIGGDGSVTDSSGNVLHSGAPIARTGPESVLAIAVMLLAGLCTFGYLRYRSYQLSLPL